VPVTRLDTATGQLTEAFRVPPGSEAITVGAGAVWVASMHTGQVIRFDLVERTTSSIDLPASDEQDVGPRPDAIAYSSEDDAVWVGDAIGAKVYRIDAPNPQVVQEFGQPASVDAIAVDGDGLWVTSTGSDRAWRIDTTSGAPGAIVDLGRDACNGPTSVTVGDDGLVWVACSLSGIVAGVDTATATVTERLDVAGVPIVGGAGGAVWSAVRPT
jgi:streptogramin lyase